MKGRFCKYVNSSDSFCYICEHFSEKKHLKMPPNIILEQK